MPVALKPFKPQEALDAVAKLDGLIQNENQRYEKLHASLGCSPENLEEIEKNWEKLLGDFADRIEEGQNLLESAQHLAIHIGNSPIDKGLQAKLIGDLQAEVEILTKTKDPHKQAIFKRLSEASEKLGAAKFPINIKKYEPKPAAAPSFWERLTSKISAVFSSKIFVGSASFVAGMVINETRNLPLLIGTAVAPMAVKTWNSGYKKTAVSMAVLAVATGVAAGNVPAMLNPQVHSQYRGY